MLNHGYWEQESKAQTPASETAADYAPGSVIDEDADGTFGSRFLYAFWRMCEQQIATITTPEPGHAARKAAAKVKVSADVRVVALRRPTSPAGPGSAARSNGTISGWSGCTKSTSGTPASASTGSASAAPTSKAPQTNHCSAGTSSKDW